MKRFSRKRVVFVLLLASLSCSPGSPREKSASCSPQNCLNGCCAKGKCIKTLSDLHCGARGDACSACAPSSRCDSKTGHCVTKGPPKVITICMAGAFKITDGANPSFSALCDGLPGLARDCNGSSCSTLFRFSNSDGAMRTLMHNLDTNRDGLVDDRDDQYDINLVGYSWGGVTATHIARDFLTSARVTPSRRHIKTLVTIDPYSPLAGGKITIPPGVAYHWNYRHTIAPSYDCSRGAPLGPYIGLPSVCSPQTTCAQYDYSLAPDHTFSYANRMLLGKDVGHCSIVRVAGSEIG
ncbi:hypothetical protein KJ865_03830, partial [Myxococcota bacterium]|nr:hypothetical protein [Myxococcota bacterium]